MSKTSNLQKLECLRIWNENRKFRAKRKIQKQPRWIKDINSGEDED